MSLFSDIVERKNRKEKETNQKHAREQEVRKLFHRLCKEHEPELRRYFSRVRILPDSLTVDHYSIVFGSLRSFLYIGYCASSTSGEVKIYFDYNWHDVKLLLIFRNALRLLFAKAYRPNVS